MQVCYHSVREESFKDTERTCAGVRRLTHGLTRRRTAALQGEPNRSDSGAVQTPL